MKQIENLRRVIAPALAAALAAACVLLSAPRADTAATDLAPHVPGEVLIRFRADAPAGAVDGILRELGADIAKRALPHAGRLLKLDGVDVAAALDRFASHPAVQYIEPNYLLFAHSVPNDPHFPLQWALRNTGQDDGLPGADIGAVAMWDAVTDASGVLVCVVDSGIDYLHEDLAGSLWTNPGEIAGNGLDDDGNGYIDDVHGYDFLGGDGEPYDENGHGTHVAGTIAATGDNGVGIAGVAWRGSILTARFLNSQGEGSTDAAIEAIDYAVAMGARVINASWGGGGYSTALEDAIRRAGEAGVLFVASAGNARLNIDYLPNYPASFALDHIVSVAASDNRDELASEPLWGSNFGAVSVDLVAPGVDIASTFPGDTYGEMSGTSMAAPHVTAALALMIGRLEHLEPLEVRDQLLGTVQTLPQLDGLCATGGRLDLFHAVGLNDTVPPAAIDDLQLLDVGGDRVDLAWTAVGDDDREGRAAAYEIRHWDLPIDEANWAEAVVVAEVPEPGEPGVTENVRIPNLEFAREYHFAVRARDEAGNRSAMSNPVSAITFGPPAAHLVPEEVSELLLTGAESERTVLLTNTGDGPLDFTVGEPALSLPGNPTPGGMWWLDSDDALGPEFEWGDILTTGELVFYGQDDALTGPLPVGFAFPFYGETYEEFYLASNGVLTFAPPDPLALPGSLPDAAAPRPLIAPLWADLDLTLGGAVFVRRESDRLVVQYQSVQAAGGTGLNTFQIILRTDGTIGMNYLEVASPLGDYTVGIQNAEGTAGLLVARSESYLRDELALRFGPMPQWLEAGPTAGSVPAGGELPIALAFDATGLCGAGFAAVIPLGTNDPERSDVELAVELEVQGEPDLVAAASGLDFDRVYIGYPQERVLRLVNHGCAELEVLAIETPSPALGAEPVNFTLAPGAAEDVILLYAPLAEESLLGDVIVRSTDPDEPALAVPVSGRALPAPRLVFAPIALADTLLTGQTASGFLTVTNTGGSELEMRVAPSAPWLAAVPRQLRIPAGVSAVIDVVYDAAGLCGAMYEGEILLTTNDPERPEAAASVSLDIEAARDIETSTEAMVFGPHFVGAVIARPLTVRNDGCEALTVSRAAVDGASFGVAAVAETFAPGEATEWTVYYRPLTVGPEAALLTIDSDDPDEPQLLIPLSGEGLPAPVIDVPGMEIHVEAEPGGVVIARPVVRNVGAADLVFTATTDSTWTSAPLDTFVVAPGDSAAIPVSLDASGLCDVAFAAPLRLATNDPVRPEFIMMLILHVAAGPDLHLPETELDFGPVYVGQTAALELALEQPGCEPLEITDVSCDAPEFNLGPEGLTVPPGAAGTLFVEFVPAEPGEITAVATIASNDADEPEQTVVLRGEGIDPPVLEILEATTNAELPTGGTEQGRLVLANTGGSELLFSLATEPLPAGPDAGPDVVAYGRPLDPAKIKRDMPDGIAATLEFDGELPVDREVEPLDTPVVNPVAAASTLEVFGSREEAYTGDFRSRGNLFRCDTATNLREHLFYLDVPIATQMWMLVYEGTARVGIYDLVSASDLSPSGPGQGWYSSGEIDLPLEVGRHYLLLASFTGVCTYYVETEIEEYPVPATFGELLMGAGWDWAPVPAFPPPEEQGVPDLFGSRAAYHQAVVTGEGTPWLRCDPVSGRIPAGEMLEVAVNLDATGLCEVSYDAEILVRGNDPVRPEVVVPSGLSVVPAPDVSVSSTSLDFGLVHAGEQGALTLTIGNPGCETLSVDAVRSGDDSFEMLDASFEILPGSSAVVPVVFRPAGTGVYKGSVQLNANDPDEPSSLVTLIGECRLPPAISATPAAVADTVVWGTYSMREVTITNTGGSDLEFQILMGPDREPDGGSFIASFEDILLLEAEVGPLIFDTALRNLGLDPIRIDSYPRFTGLLVAGLWDLVIVSNYADSPYAEALDVLAAHVAGGGLLIHSDWALGNYSRHALTDELGVEFEEDLLAPLDFRADEPDYGLFSWPNETSSWRTTGELGNVNGQHVIAAEGAVALAWYPELPNAAAIIQNEQRNALFNAFQPVNYTADDDGDGKWDIVELCENEILHLVHELYWLRADPTSGTVPAGGSVTVELTFNGWTIGGGWLETNLRVLSNDPALPELRVPVSLGLAGVSAADDVVPRVFALEGNVPNPFNPATTIAFDLPRDERVRLQVFDVRGRRVAALLDEALPAGRHSFVWRGRDDEGRPVASGVYFYRIEAGEWEATRRMVLLK